MDRAAAALLVAASIIGCREPHDAVQVRAAREFSCPEDDVRVEELGAGGYRVWACGWFATYVCTKSGGSWYGTYTPSSIACTREGLPLRYK